MKFRGPPRYTTCLALPHWANLHSHEKGTPLTSTSSPGTAASCALMQGCRLRLIYDVSVSRHSQPFQTPLSDWFQDTDERDFQNRIARQASLVDGSDADSTAESSKVAFRRAPGSSLAVSAQSQAMMARSEASTLQSETSTRPPSLITSDASTADSAEFSVSTGLASAVSGFPLFDPDGQPQAPRPAQYECQFFFLGCEYRSDDLDEWKTHCLSHFQRHEPPKEVSCPLCPFRGAFSDGFEAWDIRLNHIAEHHQGGYSLAASRPDFALYQFLWKKKIIGDVDHKELRTTGGRLSRVGAYTTTQDTGPHGRRR